MSKEKGITLIALVITIIVIMILAGVSLQSTIGNQGIIHKALNAKEQTSVEEEKKQMKSTVYACYMEDELYYDAIPFSVFKKEFENLYGEYVESIMGVNDVPNNSDLLSDSQQYEDYNYAQIEYNTGRIYCVRLNENTLGNIGDIIAVD